MTSGPSPPESSYAICPSGSLRNCVGRAALLIGAGRQGRGDRERGGDNDGSSRIAMHYSYSTNLISLSMQEERFASRPSITSSGRGFYRQLRSARGWKIVVKVGD